VGGTLNKRMRAYSVSQACSINSHFHNINDGNFYNTAGDAHIYNATTSSSQREFPTEVIILMFT
jgi:hypothetical protein